ncbi:hypothetical protein B0T26DRAFT_875168 [Lasiosphaeria miniovina]|uniref:Uncharacterized protein n=1 Tax=Lasiosphaeria miniovina TaxID=1954250 RepID=A0AA40A6X1_9PEZI|nr:uncharacterized protein B0T26DRAFT_875168 [Lasiosphaeria miniovina]KAK0710337.1 hypothetical protein B0T26DRAFT_875168 [Lasiosphaeria miniovina]
MLTGSDGEASDIEDTGAGPSRSTAAAGSLPVAKTTSTPSKSPSLRLGSKRKRAALERITAAAVSADCRDRNTDAELTAKLATLAGQVGAIKRDFDALPIAPAQLKSGEPPLVVVTQKAVNDMLARMDDIHHGVEFALRELLGRIHGLESRVVDRDAQWEDLVAIKARLEDLPAHLGSLESRVNDRDTQLGSLARSVIAALGPPGMRRLREDGDVDMKNDVAKEGSPLSDAPDCV